MLGCDLQRDGFEVEFEIGTDDKGKPFADKVTAADGSSIPPPDPSRKRNNKKKAKEASDTPDAAAENGGGEAKEGDAAKKGRTRNKRRNGKKETTKTDWYSELDESVQKAMEGRSIKIESGRAFLSVGDARLKVGTGGYITLAHSSGIVAEGKYTCDKDGKLAATWEKVLKLDGSEWKVSTVDAENGALLKAIDLKDGTWQRNVPRTDRHFLQRVC